jgi:large subunit ribosomal protein L7Ae
MTKSYVKFEVAKEVADKTYEAARLAKQSGVVRKGVNEATKSVERGLASLVVIAEDIDPEEVVMHLPGLCEQRKIAFTYVPAKLELGKAIGLKVPCAAIAIEKAGEAEKGISEIKSRLSGKVQTEPKAEKKEEKKAPKPQAPKKEEKAETQAKAQA